MSPAATAPITNSTISTGNMVTSRAVRAKEKSHGAPEKSATAATRANNIENIKPPVCCSKLKKRKEKPASPIWVGRRPVLESGKLPIFIERCAQNTYG